MKYLRLSEDGVVRSQLLELCFKTFSRVKPVITFELIDGLNSIALAHSGIPVLRFGNDDDAHHEVAAAGVLGRAPGYFELLYLKQRVFMGQNLANSSTD
jgi:hypothetical protein